MTTEFADFVATQDARNTIQLNVRKWTLMLCEKLKLNYIERCINLHNRAISEGKEIGSYHKDAIEKLKNGICNYDFYIKEGGRKYHKIVMNTGNRRSVHAFVDKKTGEVYKPASFKAPAKGVRYDLRLIEDREYLLENADWAGGYLYK